MTDKIRTLCFGDMAEIVKDGYIPNGEGNIPYIGLEHIDQQTLRLNSIGNAADVESNKFRFQKGDILFGKLRPYFRKVVMPRCDGICSTDIWVVRAKEDINQNFLFYLMASQDFIDLASTGSSGTRMPRADWDYLKNTKWDIPEEKTQKQIAKILSDLDDKIELNSRMNKTLEAMGQALFKHWFVDFEFPWDFKNNKFDPSGKPYKSSGGKMLPSSLGPIPASWKVDSLGKIADVCWGDTNTTKASYVPEGFVAYSASGLDGKLAHYDYDKSGIIISAIGAECGQTWIAFEKWSCIKNTMRILPMGKIDIEYLYYATCNKDFWPRRGSAQPFISQTDARNKSILLPDANTLKQFVDLARNGLLQIYTHQKENISLSCIRNSLLPKLMSGEVKVRA